MSSASATLTDEQRIAWLRLIRTDTIGPAGIMEHMPRHADHNVTY